MSEEKETRLNNETDEAANDPRLEAALRAALQTEQPPAGFAERLETRIADAKNAQKPDALACKKVLPPKHMDGRGFDRSSVRIQLVKAAVLLLAVTLPLGWRLHHQAEMARGEAAKEQVLLALRITGTQLRSIQERTQSINAGGLPEGDSR